MRISGAPYPLLSNPEVECIHRGALRVLAEIGMEIQHRGLLQALADAGLAVDFDAQRVRFPAPFVESFLAGCEKHEWDQAQPHVEASAGVYHSRYHDPRTGELSAWTEERLAAYFALARRLEHIGSAQMLGCRLPCPAPLEPLYERLYCWKYGAQEGSSIYCDEICPHLFDLYQLRAEMLDKPLAEVFRGTVYLVPPLKLGRHEAYQLAFFRERGLRVGTGDMLALGATAPVTLAGAVTLNIAEQIALRILDWIWFDVRRLHIGGSYAMLDMRTMIYPYGRPPTAAANLMTAQMARFYGASYSGHAGLSDAKLPSAEAGYQKALTALPTLLGCGSLWVDAGLLSTDEVCSPVQLVLDNEFVSALKYFTREFRVDDEAIGFEAMLAAGPGGMYLDQEHTARHLRDEHWQPEIWTRQMLGPWMEGGQRLDVDKAREIAQQVRVEEAIAPHITDAEEADIIKVIDRAHKAITA